MDYSKQKECEGYGDGNGHAQVSSQRICLFLPDTEYFWVRG